MADKNIYNPSGKVKEKYFTKGGKIPKGTDGNLIWCEEDPKAGNVWLSKPLSKDRVPSDVVKK